MAFGVRSHKFFCCLPVRLGVFVLSLVQFLTAGVIALLMWVVLVGNKTNLSATQKNSAVIVGLIMTVMSLVSFFGFIGAIFRKRKLVNAFSSTLNWLLGFSIGTGIVWIVTLFFDSKTKFIDSCVDGSTDQDVINTCHNVNEVRFVLLGGLIVTWMVHFYMCIIVAEYVVQLQEEENARFGGVRPLQSGGLHKYEESRRDSQELLTQPPVGAYPYSDAAHSYAGPSHA